MFPFCFVDEKVVFRKELEIPENSEKRHLAYNVFEVKDNVFDHIALLIESK